jgi:hypothetical protein
LRPLPRRPLVPDRPLRLLSDRSVVRQSGWDAEASFDKSIDLKLPALSFGTHPVFVVSKRHLSINLGVPDLSAEITGGPSLTRIRARVGAAQPIDRDDESNRQELVQRPAFLGGRSFFIGQIYLSAAAIATNAIRANFLERARRRGIPRF